MNERALRAAALALALAGAVITVYMISVRYGDARLLCTTGGCATVQSSSYAEVLGVPVAVLGLITYVLIGATVLAHGPVARAAGASLALAGVVFSAYLLVIQVAVIDAVCDWCLASDGIMTALALVMLMLLRGSVRWTAA